MINYSLLNNSEKFLNAKPFPNIVIDGLFDNSFLESVLENFPAKKDIAWWKYDNYFEKKLACNNLQSLHPTITEYFNIVNSLDFVKRIESMTNIKGLISDPSLHGGGLHKIERGGKLDIHADFNYHKITGWKRRLNIITFLNKDWEVPYNGATEFWNKDMTKCVKKILPIFNRTIIFCVDDTAYHGHPEPLMTPLNVSRKSLAAYYYTHHNDNIRNMEYRSTDYKKRPGDLTSKNIETLRKKRRKGRIEDSTTKGLD